MKTKKRLLSILLSLVMVLGLMPGMSLTVQAASAVNVKIVTTQNSGSSWTIAESTTLPQDYTVAALMPMMGWDQDSYNIQVNGTNAQIKSGSGKDMVITISDKGTFTIEVNYDYYGMPMTKNATVSVTELVAAHTHTWAIAWSHDATYHWHACTGEGASDACLNETGSAKAEHTYGDTGDARFTCTVCEYVDTVKQAASGLADAKTTATATVNGVNSDDYIAADQQTVTDAKSTALNAINTATTEAEVTTALTNFNNAIAGCTTQAAADLATAKTNATATVNGVDANGYIEADRQTVTNAKTTALNAINTATTEAEVATALTNFNNAIAGCATQAAANKAAADAAVAKIGAIGTVEFTDASKAKIDEARAAYDALTADQKALVSPETVKALTDAEAAYAALKAEAEKPLVDEVTVNGGVYKLNHATGTAVFTKPTSKNLKKLVIPDSVQANDRNYLVTEVKAGAGRGMKKLTSLTVGANVAKFGSNAFRDCKKLKTIVLKNAKMKKNGFGKDSFRNIKAKATFKVPAKMMKKYQKWLIGKAKAPETIKVKKGK